MNSELNASKFVFRSTFCTNEFKGIIAGIIICYRQIVDIGCKLPNDENKIRDYILDNYLKNDSFKNSNFPLANYHFDYETKENTGRVDIRVLPVNPYIGDKAYFIIECKRIGLKNQKGKYGLNAEYIKNGICRFVTNYYSTYFQENGMIGFITEKIDIDKNISFINSLLSLDFINDKDISVNAKPLQNLIKTHEFDNHEFVYNSKHRATNGKEIILHHLMLDLAENIQ